MALSVRKIDLWRREVENQPGMLAETLAPLAAARADLQAVMGYRFPARESQAAIEVYPISGRKMLDAARAAGLAPSGIPTLHVEGDNRPGLGHAIARALADAGINLSFLVAQVLGRKFVAVAGFENDADARKASTLIKRAAAAPRRR